MVCSNFKLPSGLQTQQAAGSASLCFGAPLTDPARHSQLAIFMNRLASSSRCPAPQCAPGASTRVCTRVHQEPPPPDCAPGASNRSLHKGAPGASTTRVCTRNLHHQQPPPGACTTKGPHQEPAPPLGPNRRNLYVQIAAVFRGAAPRISP